MGLSFGALESAVRAHDTRQSAVPALPFAAAAGCPRGAGTTASTRDIAAGPAE